MSIMRLMVGVAFAGIAACASTPNLPTPAEPTLKDLQGKRVTVVPEDWPDANRARAIVAYKAFIEAASDHPARPDALRRLGDLEIETAERLHLLPAPPPSVGSPAPWRQHYRNAIEHYNELLRTYPRYTGQDHVRYQLARAHDAVGDWTKALATLDQLLARNPDTTYRDDAQLRRGEALFALADYEHAEPVYKALIAHGRTSKYFERALYMHGWSLYQQGRYPESLAAFVALLDHRFDPGEAGVPLHPTVRAASEQFVDDIFRAAALCLARIEGAASLPESAAPARRAYELRLGQTLVDLYLRQERLTDAAKTAREFTRRNPLHPQAPLMEARIIQGYVAAGLAATALAAKAEFATRYGTDSEFQRITAPAEYARVAELLRGYLEDLARRYHAAAQKNKSPQDYDQAVTWYRTFIHGFARDARASALNFLLAEALSERRRVDEAIVEYEKTAYHYPIHAKTGDAGYSALVLYKRLLDAAPTDRALRARAVTSALRFADENPGDPRVAPVLTEAAERLYANAEAKRAASVARRVLGMKPPASADLKRVAWTVIAHADYDHAHYADAEHAYQEALTRTPTRHASRAGLVERLAASVYQQGVAARTRGDMRAAVVQFLRVGRVAPGSPLRPTAEYDAAAALIAVQDWREAVHALERFRAAYPGHALQAEIPGKLAVVYYESGAFAAAAAEFEKIMAANPGAERVREANWRAAELYERAGRPAQATALYERYVQRYPRPLAPAIEARARLVAIAEQDQAATRARDWRRALIDAEGAGGTERTDRTRSLAAAAALALARLEYDAYREVRLVEPLKQSLRNKKERMQDALAAYDRAARYGVADVATAATYHMAEIYRDLAKALLESQRPRNLAGAALEQYDVLLEEEAYPFEEQSIALHETNARRARDGLYDEWVRKSFAALSVLNPARYARTEKNEMVLDDIR